MILCTHAQQNLPNRDVSSYAIVNDHRSARISCRTWSFRKEMLSLQCLSCAISCYYMGIEKVHNPLACISASDGTWRPVPSPLQAKGILRVSRIVCKPIALGQPFMLQGYSPQGASILSEGRRKFPLTLYFFTSRFNTRAKVSLATLSGT